MREIAPCARLMEIASKFRFCARIWLDALGLQTAKISAECNSGLADARVSKFISDRKSGRASAPDRRTELRMQFWAHGRP